MSPRRILAVAYGGGHVAMLLPVLRALAALEVWARRIAVQVDDVPA